MTTITTLVSIRHHSKPYMVKCRSPVGWHENGETHIIKPELSREAMVTIFQIRSNLLTTHYVNLFKIIKKVRFVAHELESTKKLSKIHSILRVPNLNHSRISIVKVRWESKRGPEFTWEREDQMRAKYPLLFTEGTSK